MPLSTSTTSPVWFLWVFCRWRNNVFNLSRDLTRPPQWGVFQINGWAVLMYYHHSDKYGDQRDCDSGDLFLICHVTSQDCMFKGFYKFMEVPQGKSPPCHLWWPLVKCKGKYKVFKLPCYLARPGDWRIM